VRWHPSEFFQHSSTVVGVKASWIKLMQVLGMATPILLTLKISGGQTTVV
jgi:hypothetical protein